MKPVTSVRAVARGRKKNASSRAAGVDPLAAVDAKVVTVDEANVATVDEAKIAAVDEAKIAAVDEAEEAEVAAVDEADVAAVDEADVATTDVDEVDEVDEAEVADVAAADLDEDDVATTDVDEVGEAEVAAVDKVDEDDVATTDVDEAEVADEDIDEAEIPIDEADEAEVADEDIDEAEVADEDIDEAEVADVDLDEAEVADEDIDEAEVAAVDEAAVATADVDAVDEATTDVDEADVADVDVDEVATADVDEVDEATTDVDEADVDVDEAEVADVDVDEADEAEVAAVDEVDEAAVAAVDEVDEAALATADVDEVDEVDEAEVADVDVDEAEVADVDVDEAEVAAADMINEAELAALDEFDEAEVADVDVDEADEAEVAAVDEAEVTAVDEADEAAVADVDLDEAAVATTAISELPQTGRIKSFGAEFSRPWYRRLVPRWLRRLCPPWLRRHWWVLALCFLAGLSGGYEARSTAKVMYSASAELIVESGAGPLGPGSANDANALALSDASIIPSDEATLQLVAAETKTALPEVTKSVTAEAVSGTSVIVVSFKAKAASNAIADVNDVAQALSDGTPGAAIPNGSLVVVQLASTASRVGVVHSYGIPLGVILGLLVGGMAILAIERADPRIDDVEDLARVTGTTASAFPGPLPMVELVWNIALASGEAADVTLVPLSDAEEVEAEILWKYLTMGPNQPTMLVKLASTSSLLAQGSGPTVLVVKPNTRSRVLQATVLRLQMLGRGPVWAVLAVGELFPKFFPEIELFPEPGLLPETTT